MAKRGARTASDPVIKALEEVTEKLNATNEALRYLSARMTEGATAQTPQKSAERSRVIVDARFLATAGAAADGEDESILRALAEPHDLDMPMERLIALRNDRYAASRPRYWGIVNFDLHSAKPRFFVFDVVAQTTDSYLCAHGRGSEGPTDDGFANVFSNRKGSKATSLGIYRCAETYEGKNGYSLRLDGLESTNSNARSRTIVVHGADYVSESFAERHGRVGRSEGCPALDHEYSRTVIDQLKLGSLLIHWITP
jgi:hypothetical protein